METPPDYERMNATIIPNPSIRYFKMVLAQTFFRMSEATDTVSKEEPFIMFSVFQSCPFHYAPFMLTNMSTITN